MTNRNSWHKRRSTANFAKKRWRYFSKNWSAIFAGVLILSSLILNVDASSLRAEPAHRANDFVNTFGVNTHLSYGGGAYDTLWEAVIKPRLNELGVRHVRDTVFDHTLSKFKDLYNLYGITVSFITDIKTNPSDVLNLVKQLGPEKVAQIEGPNEPDLNYGTDWASKTYAYQKQLYQTVKSDLATKNIPIASPSILARENIADMLGSLDYGNAHCYLGGHNPETQGWGEDGYGSIDWHLRLEAKVSGSKPIVCTEAGYHSTWHEIQGHIGAPEEIIAIYIPRMYLMYFNAGWKMTYRYEFIDEGTDANNLEHNFGFLKNDGTPKASFLVMKNLINAVADRGNTQKFRPQPLNLTISGDTKDVYHTLLQKGDGTYELIVWIGKQIYHPNSKEIHYSTPRHLSILFGKNIKSARVMTPNDTAEWQTLPLSGNSISIDVTDRVKVIELRGSPDNKKGLLLKVSSSLANWKNLICSLRSS